MRDPKVVAFGGGHGLAAVLTALKNLTSQITAVVTVADNGGSSGRLRAEFNSLPPGDLRMALAALCGDDEWGRNWANLMQYRFTSNGELNGHALGNLLLAALWDRDGDQVKGLARVGELLKVVGKVLPMSLQPLDIEAIFGKDGGQKRIRGQKEVALGIGDLIDLQLLPSDATSAPDALAAINEADWLTLGPGSWISSVLPHLLLAEQRKAVCSSKAKRIVLLNLPSTFGGDNELAGLSPAEQLSQMRRFAPELQIDFVVCDQSISTSAAEFEELRVAAKSLGGEVVVRDLALVSGGKDHDPKKLAPLFADFLSGEVIR